MTSYPLIALCLLGLVGRVRSCQPLPGWVPESWPMNKILYAAPYVVIATGTQRDEDQNIATFDVTCVMKSGGINFPSQIYVPDVVFQNSCLNNPQFVLGANYILALTDANYFASGYPNSQQFDNFAPQISVQNIFDATTPNLQTTYQTCGLTPTAVQGQRCPPGSPPSSWVCPTSERPPSRASGMRNSVINVLIATLVAAWSVRQ